jgi:hypothetical protein
MFTAHRGSRKLKGQIAHREQNLQSNSKVIKSKSPVKLLQKKIQNTNREYTKWSEPEKEAVNRQFYSFITKMKCPRQLDCLNAQAKESALANRTWKTIKFYVSTQINKYKSMMSHKPQNM